MLFRISFLVAWYDIWIGVFVDTKDRAIYVCPFPCLVMRINWGRKYWKRQGSVWKRSCGHLSLVHGTDHHTGSRFWIVYTNGSAWTENEGFTPKFPSAWKAMEYVDSEMPMEESYDYSKA